MTSPNAAKFYQFQYESTIQGKGKYTFNPLNKSLDDLIVLYGFNKEQLPSVGSVYENHSGFVISPEGEIIGEHICSSESYMLSDLGILEGTAEWRHSEWEKKFPQGYKMDFISFNQVEDHEELQRRLSKLIANSGSQENDAPQDTENKVT